MPDTLADLVKKRYGPETPGGAGLPAEGPLAAILDRRTHRRYADRPVPEDMLDLLFACAFSASAKSDLQQASVVRIADPALRAEIAALIPWHALDRHGAGVHGLVRRRAADQAHLRRCAAGPSPTTIWTPPSTRPSIPRLPCRPSSCRRRRWASAAARSASCATTAFRIGELLGLPEWVFPVAGLCVGWPAAQGYISMRVPPSVTVHTDRYDDDKLAAGIDAYDRRRDAVYSIPPDKQRDLDLYGEAAFYGWSEDKARQVSHTEREDFGAFLREQGYRLD